jgi:cytochrome c oxidase subunit II
MTLRRRQFLRRTVGAVVTMAAPTVMIAATRTDSVVAVSVRKFEFEPNEISVPAGREVTLAFRSSDFVHGFSLPEFGIRADLVPGRTVEVKVRPSRSGRYLFVCDNFCGDGHDRMAGVLVVNAS